MTGTEDKGRFADVVDLANELFTGEAWKRAKVQKESLDASKESGKLAGRLLGEEDRREDDDKPKIHSSKT